MRFMMNEEFGNRECRVSRGEGDRRLFGIQMGGEPARTRASGCLYAAAALRAGPPNLTLDGIVGDAQQTDPRMSQHGSALPRPRRRHHTKTGRPRQNRRAATLFW
jgi:hypothetical protein